LHEPGINPPCARRDWPYPPTLTTPKPASTERAAG